METSAKKVGNTIYLESEFWGNERAIKDRSKGANLPRRPLFYKVNLAVGELYFIFDNIVITE